MPGVASNSSKSSWLHGFCRDKRGRTRWVVFKIRVEVVKEARTSRHGEHPVTVFAYFSCDDAAERGRQSSRSHSDMCAARADDFHSYPDTPCRLRHAVSLMMIIVADVFFTYRSAQRYGRRL
jgi:hypothetical protein